MHENDELLTELMNRTPMTKSAFEWADAYRRTIHESRGSILRRAIAALREAPDTVAVADGKCTSFLPVFYATTDDFLFVRQLSWDKDVTVSQIMRNALQALKNKVEKEALIENPKTENT